MMSISYYLLYGYVSPMILLCFSIISLLSLQSFMQSKYAVIGLKSKLELKLIINTWTPKLLIPTYIALAWVADCLVWFQNYFSLFYFFLIPCICLYFKNAVLCLADYRAGKSWSGLHASHTSKLSWFVGIQHARMYRGVPPRNLIYALTLRLFI